MNKVINQKAGMMNSIQKSDDDNDDDDDDDDDDDENVQSQVDILKHSVFMHQTQQFFCTSNSQLNV